MARFLSLLLYITGAALAECLPVATDPATAIVTITVPKSTSPPIATNAFHVEWTYENDNLDFDANPDHSGEYTIIIAEPWNFQGFLKKQCLNLPDSDKIIFSTTVSGMESSISVPASELDIVSPDETTTVDFLFFSQDYSIFPRTITFPHVYYTNEYGVGWWGTSESPWFKTSTWLRYSSIRLSMTSPTFAPATNIATSMTMTITTTATATTTMNTAVSTDAVIPDGDEKTKDGDGGQSTGDKVGIGVGVPSGVIVFAGAIFWAYSKWWKRE